MCAHARNMRKHWALLKILAFGKREIEQGRYRSADEVFAELDKEDV